MLRWLRRGTLGVRNLAYRRRVRGRYCRSMFQSVLAAFRNEDENVQVEMFYA